MERHDAGTARAPRGEMERHDAGTARAPRGEMERHDAGTEQKRHRQQKNLSRPRIPPERLTRQPLTIAFIQLRQQLLEVLFGS